MNTTPTTIPTVTSEAVLNCKMTTETTIHKIPRISQIHHHWAASCPTTCPSTAALSTSPGLSIGVCMLISHLIFREASAHTLYQHLRQNPMPRRYGCVLQPLLISLFF